MITLARVGTSRLWVGTDAAPRAGYIDAGTVRLPERIIIADRELYAMLVADPPLAAMLNNLSKTPGLQRAVGIDIFRLDAGREYWIENVASTPAFTRMDTPDTPPPPDPPEWEPAPPGHVRFDFTNQRDTPPPRDHPNCRSTTTPTPDPARAQFDFTQYGRLSAFVAEVRSYTYPRAFRPDPTRIPPIES